MFNQFQLKYLKSNVILKFNSFNFYFKDNSSASNSDLKSFISSNIPDLLISLKARFPVPNSPSSFIELILNSYNWFINLSILSTEGDAFICSYFFVNSATFFPTASWSISGILFKSGFLIQPFSKL